MKKEQVEDALASCFTDVTPLHDACAYSLKTGGKRFRPKLVFLMAEALGKGLDVLDGAVAV